MLKKWIVLGAAIALVGPAVSCGKKPGSANSEAPAAAASAPAEAPAAAAGVGSISGVVKYSGQAPQMPELNRQSDPVCAGEKMNAQYVVVNDNATLKNVAVTVEGVQGAKQDNAIVVDQKACMYEPRIQVVTAGQEIQITNSDATLHNVHTYKGSKTLFNRAQPKGSKALKKSFEAGIVKFKCDVHPWMTGWLVSTESGFGTVSNAQGAFEIKDVPAGTYTLKFFQEYHGEKTVSVTVEADKVASVEVSYDGTERAAYDYREVLLSQVEGAHQH